FEKQPLGGVQRQFVFLVPFDQLLERVADRGIAVAGAPEVTPEIAPPAAARGITCNGLLVAIGGGDIGLRGVVHFSYRLGRIVRRAPGPDPHRTDREFRARRARSSRPPPCAPPRRPPRGRTRAGATPHGRRGV